MKNIIPVALIALNLSCGGPGYISPGDLQSHIEKGDAVIIDLRNSNKFSDGHIKGAINAEYHEATFLRDIKEIDKKSAVILYCGEGIKSDKAAEVMKKNGFVRILILKGGFTSWINENFHTEK